MVELQNFLNAPPIAYSASHVQTRGDIISESEALKCWMAVQNFVKIELFTFREISNHNERRERTNEPTNKQTNKQTNKLAWSQ